VSRFSIPGEHNDFLASHIAILRNSLHHWSGRELVDPGMSDSEAARFVFRAPFVLVSHDTREDPVFNYANETALSLFAMSWDEFTTLPSRESAEPMQQDERERLLREVSTRGYIDHYRGVRIGRHGRRFRMDDAMVWNLLDSKGKYYGQAAWFERWSWA
jgi:hypothetical protein